MGTGAVLRFALCLTVLSVETSLSNGSWSRHSRHAASDTRLPKAGCVLSEPPEFGNYTSPACVAGRVLTECQSTPGSIVPHSWLLRYRCHEAYSFHGGKPDVYTFCVDGTWTPGIPACSTSQICGKKKSAPKNNYPVSPTADEEDSILPWFAAIYLRSEDKQLEHTCGGTLVSPHVVLTAAHCVTHYNGSMTNPDMIKVALGKRLRDWTRDEPGAVKSDVKEIRIAPGYYGQTTLYAHDMALINLKAEVPLNGDFLPACIDWGWTFNLTSGQLGMLAGWSITENKTISSNISYLQIPYEEWRRCILIILPMLRRYVTPDKFCSLPTDGIDVPTGYAGGGLTFEHNGVHYVRGILSTKIKGNNPTFVTFSNVQDVQLSSWLQETIRSFDEDHTSQ